MKQEVLDNIYEYLEQVLDDKQQEALDVLVRINGYKIETFNDFTFYYFGERNATALLNDEKDD